MISMSLMQSIELSMYAGVDLNGITGPSNHFYPHQRMPQTGPSDIGPLWFVFTSHRALCMTVLIAGGNWNNGLNAGLGAANANNALSNSNCNIGARPAYPSEVYSIIILGKDPASWQKTKTNDSRRTGKCAHGCGHPNVGSRSIYSRGAPSS